jgi:hypothetical protein
MAVLSWGSSGPEVERLQQQLQVAGFFFGTVDGQYGALTYAAVKRFQQSMSLPTDGIAGPQTLAMLQSAVGMAPSTGTGGGTTGGGTTGGGTTGGGTTGGGVKGGGRTMSVHIGLNRVDPAKYGGWDGRLSGCERDAQTMTDIAQAEGFAFRQLLSPQATSVNILQEIRRAAQTLRAGGTFLLTYAGHGGQVADPSGDEETDELDETWVAYDRQILDDELEQAFAEFESGVDIVVCSDSCHSGSMYRLLPPGLDLHEATGTERTLQRQYAELKSSFYRNLTLPRPGPGDPPFAGFPVPSATREGLGQDRELMLVGVREQAMVDDNGRPAPVFAPAPVSTDRGLNIIDGVYATRNLPQDYNEVVNNLQREVLARAKIRARSRDPVRARGVLLSGCMDNQLSQEVGGAGVFTTALNRVWSNNQFRGTYFELMDQVLPSMGPTQSPQLSTFGNDALTLAAKTPFDVVRP